MSFAVETAIRKRVTGSYKLGSGRSTSLIEPIGGWRKLSARWIGGVKHASVFVRVAPAHAYRLRVTAHHLRVPAMLDLLNLTICNEPVEVQRSLSADGTGVLVAEISAELAARHEGRSRIGVIYDDLYDVDGWASFSRFETV